MQITGLNTKSKKRLNKTPSPNKSRQKLVTCQIFNYLQKQTPCSSYNFGLHFIFKMMLFNHR